MQQAEESKAADIPAIDYSTILTPEALRHLTSSVIAAIYEGNEDVVIESDYLLSLWSDTLTPAQLRLVDWEVAENVLFAKLAEIDAEHRAQAEAPAESAAESAADAHVEPEAPEVAAAPAEPAKAPASPEFVTLMAQARQARYMARETIAKARASSSHQVNEERRLRADLSLLAQEIERTTRRAAEQVVQQAAKHAQQDMETARMLAEFPELVPIDGTKHGGTAAAPNIRRVLKKRFPGVKFSVTSDYSSVNVKWTDGPTTAAVDEALAPFDIGHSDITTDYFYTEKTRFSEAFGGVQYLFTNRTLGKETITASIAALYGDNGPTYEEWQAGRGWSQVASHGTYGPNAYSSEWDWLSHVRRHANGSDY